MNFFIVFFLFFLLACCFMPLIGFSYKVCERIYKRSLFGKAAKQIQLFSAILFLLIFFALTADYLMKGLLFQADTLLGEFQSVFLDKGLLVLLCAVAILCILNFLCVKFFKSTILYFISSFLGLCIALYLVKWTTLLAVSANNSSVSNQLLSFLNKIYINIFDLPMDFFINNPYALFSSTTLFSYLVSVFILLSAFLCSLYFICVLSFLFRNSMDYGRDFYNFMFNKYGKAIFSFSVLFCFAGIILLLGYQIPFQQSAENVFHLSGKKLFYTQMLGSILPIMLALVSLKFKRVFALASLPMQKKSILVAALILDCIFVSAILFLILIV